MPQPTALAPPRGFLYKGFNDGILLFILHQWHLPIKSSITENSNCAAILSAVVCTDGILLFLQFTGMLDRIAAALAEAGIPYVMLTGYTTSRSAPVNQFMQGTVPLFLISLKTGGVGLNLTAADTVIHYDPWWTS